MSHPLTLRDLDRLLVFGGTYGNLQATEALLAEADRLGVTSDQMLCTGDLVAYCAEPQATVDLIRSRDIPVVMGNCEEALGADAEDCGCGFDEGSLCSLLSRQWYAFCRANLTTETRRWMAELPRSLRVGIGGRELAAVHGAYGAINRFVFPSTPAADKAHNLAAAGAEGMVAGHSGLPFAQILGGKLWLNSGALGMPANDSTPRVWYAMLSVTGDGLAVELRALDYDHRTAAQRMAAAGLANGYADCLVSGLWPSLDVLPPAERRATGRPLQPQRLVWSERPLREAPPRMDNWTAERRPSR